MDEFEQTAQFISWCIEEYAFENKISSKETANFFNEKGVLDFLKFKYLQFKKSEEVF